MTKSNDEKLKELVKVAFDVLEHDSSENDKEHIFSANVLYNKFANILGFKVKQNKNE